MAGPDLLVAPVRDFLVSCEESLRSSFGRGWLELPIVDLRLSIEKAVWRIAPLSIGDRQSAIDNRPSKGRPSLPLLCAVK
jgi:hypothetical protein